MHETVEHEVDCAYAAGYHQALIDVAERADVLDASWRPVRRRDPEQVIAERIAAMPPIEGVEAWLDAARLRAAQRDAAARIAGQRATPISTWAQVREFVSDRVWARILDDLAPGPKGSRDKAIAEAAGVIVRERGAAA